MKYILMMNTMRANAGVFPEWSPKAIQIHVAFMKKIFGRETSHSPEQ